MYDTRSHEDFFMVNSAEDPPLMNTSHNDEILVQEIEEAFNDEEYGSMTVTDTELTIDDSDIVEIHTDEVDDIWESENNAETMVNSLSSGCDNEIKNDNEVKSDSERKSNCEIKSDSDNNCESSDTSDSETENGESDYETETDDEHDQSIDLSWELVDFEVNDNEKEQAENILHKLSIVSEQNEIAEDFEQIKKSRVIRKFIGNSNLIEKLHSLNFREVTFNDPINAQPCHSLYLGETLESSMIIYNKAEDPYSTNDHVSAVSNQSPIRSTTWRGEYLGGEVEVRIEETKGINVVDLQVLHKDILSSLLSFQRFVALTGMVSYCDVDVSSLLAHPV